MANSSATAAAAAAFDPVLPFGLGGVLGGYFVVLDGLRLSLSLPRVAGCFGGCLGCCWYQPRLRRRRRRRRRRRTPGRPEVGWMGAAEAAAAKLAPVSCPTRNQLQLWLLWLRRRRCRRSGPRLWSSSGGRAKTYPPSVRPVRECALARWVVRQFRSPSSSSSLGREPDVRAPRRPCVRRCLPPCFPAVFQFEPNVGSPFVNVARPLNSLSLTHSVSQSVTSTTARNFRRLALLESRFFVAQTYVQWKRSCNSTPRCKRSTPLPSFLPSFLLEPDDVLSSTHSQGEPHSLLQRERHTLSRQRGRWGRRWSWSSATADYTEWQWRIGKRSDLAGPSVGLSLGYSAIRDKIPTFAWTVMHHQPTPPPSPPSSRCCCWASPPRRRATAADRPPESRFSSRFCFILPRPPPGAAFPRGRPPRCADALGRLDSPGDCDVRRR